MSRIVVAVLALMHSGVQQTMLESGMSDSSCDGPWTGGKEAQK
jgi:hypothetical protein